MFPSLPVTALQMLTNFEYPVTAEYCLLEEKKSNRSIQGNLSEAHCKKDLKPKAVQILCDKPIPTIHTEYPYYPYRNLKSEVQ